MKIRDRLTLLFTALIAGLLLAFAFVIYYSYSQNREEEYFKRIKEQAITKANLLLDAKVTPSVLQLIYKNSPNSLFQEQVAIYDTHFNLLYHDAVDRDIVNETQQMMDNIISKKFITFYTDNFQVVGFLYHHNNKDYAITAAAKDDYGFAKLANLRFTLIITFLVSIVLIFFGGLIFAKQALKPVSNLVHEVEEITATNLDLRVNEGNGKDELAELATTFNAMLNRLESSFDAQKQFVSNISHELRTPLAAIITELELSTIKEQTTEEYKHIIQVVLNDAKKLVRLSNGLLDLAKANYDEASIKFKEVRLDELLLDARHDLLKVNPSFKVNITFEKEELEDDSYISIVGNEYLLKVAFINLMENGCKFSPDKECNVEIIYHNRNTVLRFKDNGIGIKNEDLTHIFTPFYRGANKDYTYGNGIGLSLTSRIIKMHKGVIEITSEMCKGTTVTIEFSHI